MNCVPIVRKLLNHELSKLTHLKIQEILSISKLDIKTTVKTTYLTADEYLRNQFQLAKQTTKVATSAGEHEKKMLPTYFFRPCTQSIL